VTSPVQIRKAIIPAAGLGTRLYPATKSQPKEMLPLGRKPAIQLVAEEAVCAGLNQILIITGQKKRAIEDHFDQNNQLYAEALKTGLVQRSILDEAGRANFFYTRQHGPRGLGDAVYCAKDFVDAEHFVVALGDAVIARYGRVKRLLTRLIEAHLEREAAATIAVREVPRSALSSYGIVAPAGEVDSVFDLKDLVEKPAPEEAPSNLAITARYVFSPDLFSYIERTGAGYGGEIQLTDAIKLMLQDGRRVVAVRLAPLEKRYDLGSFQDYALAFIEVALADESGGAELRHRLQALLEEPAPTSLLVGDQD